MADTDIKSVDKVNEELVNQLIELGMIKKKAVDTASLFLFSWMKSKGGGKTNIETYEQDVNTFVDKLKKSTQK